MTSEILDHLKSLHTAAIDARNGYRRALEDAGKGPDLTRLFRDMAALHDRNAAELATLLAGAGERPDDGGSFMSTIHRAIMDIRSLFGGLDESILPGLIDGEERNIGQYDDALPHAAHDANLTAALSGQRERLVAALTHMKTTRAAA
jgi:uncharacterized protein (TIGR02284 family)